ncbi:MAG: Spy/CpxP family protein refolding chaperone [Nitrospinota bacterium]|nr:Spy/CpxP family protein refolding chaperone [Nitrospinota bacterium]MDH5679842.1 Spy/CpxP family protein refolding chaperone [Nitrospinota bacterium]MDH5756394.1 Spy/CpxP family protein refolding chaperone [Nitrospinota bacterium]
MDKKVRPENRAFIMAICAIWVAAFLLATPNASATSEKTYAQKDRSEEQHAEGAPTPGESATHIKKVLKHASDIGLSEEQRGQIADIYVKAMGESASINAQIEVTISAFMALYKQGKVNEEAIRDYSGKMGDLRGRFLFNNLKAMNDVKGVLTKEQRETIHKIYKTHGKK